LKQTNRKDWKAGVSCVKITPRHPIWLAGYDSRRHPSKGTLTDLWAKVLALEDTDGKQAILVTMDLLGIPKQFSERIRNQLETKFHLSRSQIILNASHTHSGPVLTDALVDVYPIQPDSHQQDIINQYTNELKEKIVVLVEKAFHSMKSARLYAGNGVTRFQVNRITNREEELTPQMNLHGPNDYAVPVIKVADKEGKLIAIAFGYACHNTVLDGYKWCGDYTGFAQMALEKAYPETTALFFQGAGGDQNPLPRRSVSLAKQYGKELAAAVVAVIDGDMRKLQPQLTTAYSEVKLLFSSLPTKEILSKKAKNASGFQKRWAGRMFKKLERGESFNSSYPYPLEIWKLGSQFIIALGGEPTVGYAIKLKQILGQDIFVLGYSNDVMGYIPTEKILQEGGYEGASSQMAYGLPAPWAPGIEATIIHEVTRLAKKAGISQPAPKFIETEPQKNE
jgi:hypothetical protein